MNDDDFEGMPLGFPTRSSFQFIPKEKKVFNRREAKNLRIVFLVMMPVHIGLLFVDFIIYNFEIPIIIVDMMFVWLNFVNYMTLNKIMIFVELVLYFLASFTSLSHTKRVFIDQDSKVVCLAFILQFFVIYPTAFFIGGNRLIKHFKQ